MGYRWYDSQGIAPLFPFGFGDLPAAGEPRRQLKGYQRISLAPGHNATATITLGPRAFSIWDSGTQSWVEAPGCYTVWVGDSSRSLPLSGKIGIGTSNC